MKPINLLLISILIISAIVLYFVIDPKSNESDNGRPASKESIHFYTKQVATQRQDKDVFFKTSPDSPLENKAAFSGLSYFPVSSEYQVTARLEPFADKTQKLVIPLSDGSEEVYEKYGHAVFKLRGEICRLLILRHDNVYSVMFKDATSGTKTYGGGRYIDLEADSFNENQVEIDFNSAYNPYCVYNHNYACPLPPSENTLPIEVEAGEKLPK